MFGKQDCAYEFITETATTYILYFRVKISNSWILRKAAMHSKITNISEANLKTELDKFNIIPVRQVYWKYYDVGLKPHYKKVKQDLKQEDDIELLDNQIANINYVRNSKEVWEMNIKTIGTYKDLKP